MKRHGVTLIESLMMTAVAVGLVTVAYGMLKKSNALMDSTGHTIDLQVGVRNLLENMVRDVGGCQQIMQPQGDPARSLVLIKPAVDDPTKRLDKNPDKAFPFRSSQQNNTPQKLDALRVTYTWDAQKKIVRRKEESGEFTAETEPNAGDFLTKFSFAPAKVESDRELATSVETLALTYVGYDPESGNFKKVGQGGLPFEKTACIAVRINSQFDEGLYAGNAAASGRTLPKIEIFTKIWSMKRRSDETYKEYFSSTDEDLRW